MEGLVTFVGAPAPESAPRCRSAWLLTSSPGYEFNVRMTEDPGVSGSVQGLSVYRETQRNRARLFTNCKQNRGEERRRWEFLQRGRVVHITCTKPIRVCAQNVNRKPREEGSTMGVLRKKNEPTETITVRIPSSARAELDQLRERADASGRRAFSRGQRQRR